VRDAGAIGGDEGGQNVQPDRGCHLRVEWPVVAHHLMQGARRHVLHDDPGLAVGLDDVEDLHHVRVAEPGGGAGLTQRTALQGVRAGAVDQ
jgi:hypothetical protein